MTFPSEPDMDHAYDSLRDRELVRPLDHEWVGMIRNYETRVGKTTKGNKHWTLYILHGADGTKFGTFDKADMLFCIRRGQEMKSVRICFERDAKGNRSVFSVEAAE